MFRLQSLLSVFFLLSASWLNSDPWVLDQGPILVEAEYPFPQGVSTYRFRYELGSDWVELWIHPGEGLFFRSEETGPCSELRTLQNEEERWYLFPGSTEWEIYFQSSLEGEEFCLWFQAWFPEWQRWALRSVGRPYSLMPPTLEIP